MPKCPPTGGVRLQEVSVSGGSTVSVSRQWMVCFASTYFNGQSDLVSR